MKRVLVLLVAVIFLFAGSALAADSKAGAVKGAPAKAASMTASGKIVDLSDTMLKLERSGKGKAETMEFGLEKPVSADIKAGDKVTVHYVSKDGKRVATKVNKAAAKKSSKKK